MDDDKFYWMLTRPDQQTQAGVDSLDDMIKLLAAEDLPGTMPIDWALTLDAEEGERQNMSYTHEIAGKTIWRVQWNDA